ncbi:MAG: DUF2207 domain-containing protein [Armatimonadetes bacterium]|nr:DUF2207 domain-containing protein [Armatimonadota bacterium]
MQLVRRDLALVTFVALSGICLAQSGPYSIDSFDVRIWLNEDTTIEVEETIAVTFNEPRRGIFRTIPVVYPTGGGQERAIHLRVIGVTDLAGNRQQTKISREGNNLKIRIGNPDVYLPAETQRTYVIRYTVFGALNWHDDDSRWEPWTELYWNVTGTEWDVPIESASFWLQFPETDIQNVRGQVFIGRYGSANTVAIEGANSIDADNRANTAITLQGQVFSGSTSSRIYPGSGLTIVFGIPQDALPKLPWHKELLARIVEYLALFTPLVVVAILLPIWNRIGRDVKDIAIPVQFEPPDGISASLAGTLIDERVDQRDLAAGIMSLAVNGFLLVEIKETGSVFKKNEVLLRLTDKTDTSGLPALESRLYRLIKRGGELITTKDLRENVAPMIQSLRTDLYDQAIARGYYLRNPATVRSGWILGGFALSGGVAYALFSLSIIQVVPAAIVGGLLGVVPAVWIGWHMPKRTRYGSAARRKVLGFYEMMRHRENYLKWVVETQPDGLKYEQYLAYAVAFDLIEQWNDAFKDILTEPPSWYKHPYGMPFHASLFAAALGHIVSQVGSAASMPLRADGASSGSSGFGGGGFSGGGFGGGGGGSW